MRYHWVKLDTAFFERKEIKKLRSINDKYVVIYLKLLLAAANSEGYLKYEGIEEDIYGELALASDESREDIKAVCLFLEKLNLFSIVDGDAYLPEAVKNVGSEGSSAKRVREYRERKQALQCNNDVTSSSLQSSVEREKSREEEIREEREGEKDYEQDEKAENNCASEKAESSTSPSPSNSFNQSSEEAEKKLFALEFIRVFNSFTSSNAKNINEVMGYTDNSNRATDNLEALRKAFNGRRYYWPQCLSVAQKESQKKSGKIIKGKERFWHFRELLFYYLQNGNGKSDEIGRHYTKDELDKIAKVEAENKIAQQESLRIEEKEKSIAKKLGMSEKEFSSKVIGIQMAYGTSGVIISSYETLLDKIESGEIEL